MRLNRAAYLPLLFAAALSIRIVVLLLLRDPYAGPSPRHGADGVEYDQLAAQVAAGHGYVSEQGRASSFRAPGLPLWLASLYAVAGQNYLLARLSFCLLGACACLLAYALARELLAEGWAQIAGGLSTVYVPHVYFATVFDSENLFVPALGLGVWLFVRFLKGNHHGVLACAGLVLGAATLTRPFALALLPLLALVLAIDARLHFFHMTRSVAILTAGFVVVLAPWTARNYAVHDRFVLVASNGGSTFYGSNNDLVFKNLSRMGTWVSTTELPGRDVIESMPDEIAHDKKEWQLGLAWVRAHPRETALLAGVKALRLILPDFDSPNRAYLLLQVVTYTPFLLLFLSASVRFVSNPACWSAPWLAVHASLGATLLTAVIFWGSPRFRDANMPLLMVYATVGLQTLLALWRKPVTEKAVVVELKNAWLRSAA